MFINKAFQTPRGGMWARGTMRASQSAGKVRRRPRPHRVCKLLPSICLITASLVGLIGVLAGSVSGVEGISGYLQRRARRPNIVLIVTDQERAPPAYEDASLKSFRAEHLHGYRELGCVADDDDGRPSSTMDGRGKRTTTTSCVRFDRHYTSSTACTPSRANLFTGQYASVHGVRRTDGANSLPLDVPTMGHYFEAAGYETRYVGKWHLSHEDLRDFDGRPTRGVDGTVDRRAEAEYLEKDPLSKYGFHGWVGPEPHGTAEANAGVWRDPHTVEQALEWVRARNATDATSSSSSKPFLLVVNIINPHDVCLWRAWEMFRYPSSDDDTVPPIPAPPTLGEDLTSKPTPQSGWKRFGTFTFGGPNWDGDDGHDEYRRFYHYLQKLADGHVATIVRALKSSPFWDDTIVVRTSDHGEMLGAHGLLQKWYSAYDEALKVPFVVSSPLFGRGLAPRALDFPTSSVDLLPTMLSLAGLDAKALQKQLSARHSETHPLVGVDLSTFVVASNEEGSAAAAVKNPNAVYSSMSDHVSLSPLFGKGILCHSHWVPRLLLKLYHFERDPVEGPTSTEVVVAVIDGTDWKLVRTFDDPALWIFPYQNDSYVKRAGVFAGRGKELVRTEPWAEEWEMYDLTSDPYEEKNLADKDTLEMFGSGPEADRRSFDIQIARTNLRREMSRLRQEKALQRKTPLPEMPSSHMNVYLVDIWDIASDRFGMLGPIFLGCHMLATTILHQEPVLKCLVFPCCLIVLGIAIAVTSRIMAHRFTTRPRVKSQKRKVA